MRMFLTGFEKPVVLRFATLELVRGEWRTYTDALNNTQQGASTTSYLPSTSKKTVIAPR